MALKRLVKKSLFRVARARVLGRVVGLAFARFSGVLPLSKVYESDSVVAFRHPQPSHAVHILIVPRQAKQNLMQLTPKDSDMLAEVVWATQKIVRELGLEASGYRLVVNGGKYQDAQQLHFHLISGAEV